MVCKLVRGTVILENMSPYVPLADVVVQVGALRGTRFSVIGETRTAQDGTFSLDLSVLPSVDPGATVMEVRVLEQGERLTAHGDIRWRRSVDPGPLVVCVERDPRCSLRPESVPLDIPGQHNVWGRVRHHDGTPLTGLSVEIREVTNTAEVLVVATSTDAQGWFAATVGPPRDIVVRVLEVAQPPAQSRLLGSSRAHFSPTFPLRIDVDVCDDAYRGATEWNRLSTAMAPLLGATLPVDVGTRVVAVLSGRSGWDVERITLWVLAHKMGQALSADPEPLYGLLRLGFPRSQEALLARPRNTIGPALTRAVSLHLIGSTNAIAPDLDLFLSALSTGLKGALNGTRKDTLGEILRTSGVLTNLQISDFIGLYVDHEGSEEEFWSLVYSTPVLGLPSFDAASKAEAQRLLTLGTIALSFAPAVSSILVTVGAAPASAVGSIDAAGWTTIVSPARLPTLPEGLPGDDDTARRSALAAYLAEHAERMFPSATARAGLLTALGLGHPLQPAASFLAANPSFDLAVSRVDDVAFSGSALEKDATQKVQRLYRVAPGVGRAAVVAELGSAGFDSAWSIARRTRARFVAESVGTLDPEIAELVASKAGALAALTTMAVSQLRPENSQRALNFLPRADVETPPFPDWETLFGNASGCACGWCRSVHGPAAYLVDLLRWLGDRPVSAGAGSTLYDTLVARRPDLVHIQLSCENAERALPYIDLVLEALESAVARDPETGEVGIDAAHASLVSTPDMLASPQHRNDVAYGKLLSATKAVALPFHRSLSEAKAFLSHLGVQRVDLLRAWKDVLGAAASTHIATEQLGLFSARLGTITAPAGSETAYWPVPLTELDEVPTLRRAGALSWPDVLDLLHTRYANPRTWNAGSATWSRVLEVAATDWCDLDTYTIKRVGGSEPSSDDWTRVRQFLRLWRTTGGTALELDKILAARAVDDLNADAWLDDVARLHHLAADTGLAVLELAQVGVSLMDTYEDRATREEPVPSLYDQVYLSPAVLVEGDPSFAAFQLNGQRNGLASAGATLLDHAAVVSGALGWTRQDLEVALAKTTLTALTLENLTTLYAWSVVGRATRLRPEDLFGLVGLTGLAPLTSTADLEALVDTATALRTSGFPVDVVRYLTLHERASRVGATTTFVQVALGRVRDALRAEFEATSDTRTEASVREVALRVLADQLGTSVDLIQGLRSLPWPKVPTVPEGTTFTLVENATVVPASGSITLPAETSCLLPAGTALSGMDPLAVPTLATLTTATVGSVTSLSAARGTAWSRSAAGTATFGASTAFGVPSISVPAGTVFTNAAGASIIVTGATTVQPQHLVTVPSAVTGSLSFASAPPATDMIQRFLRDTFIAGDALASTTYGDITADSAVYADDFTVFQALHKAVLLTSRLDLDEEDRAFWLDVANPVAWNIAPPDGLSGNGSASFSFAELSSLIALFGLRHRIPGQSPSFAELLRASDSITLFKAALAERTDWDEADIATLAGQAGADPSTVAGFSTLLDRLAIVRRLGADASMVTGWAVPPGDVDAAGAAQVVGVARARHASAEAWGEVARPVRDVLRRLQRDALVAWLLGTVGSASLRNAEDLYQHYLIDVSMNPEMLTSRIVQASATVQLFVHRLMLGLERHADAMIFEPNAEDREQWEWMRTYRVWEAARKVFLYPENWIEPELRDDKSPFFVALERELAQGDVTEERVERAILDYLDRLREVGHLQVLGYVWHKESLKAQGGEDIDLLHVFARTRSEPPTYWYRRLENHARWTPWEKVECGVEGSHLVPVIHQRRLLLFWLEFREESADDGTDRTCWSIRSAWSEYRDGRWSPKRVSVQGVLDVAWGSAGTEGYAVTTDVDHLGRIAVHVAWRDTGEEKTGKPIASFVLDSCTMEFNAQSAYDQEQPGVNRVVAEQTFWAHPGFHTEEVADNDTWWASWLTLFRAETDSDNEAIESPDRYTKVPVLGLALGLEVVAPMQYGDFVSQSSFFVQSSTRGWFVVPGKPPPEFSVPIRTLGIFRENTEVRQDNPPSPNDSVMLAEWAPYLPGARYLDLAESEAALNWTDVELIGLENPSTFNFGGGGYRFFVFYHPHVCTFTEAVRRDGVFALLDPDPDGPEANLATGSLRRQQVVGLFDFEAELLPNPDHVDPRYPVEDVDFSEAGAYSGYNWELFFHVPLYTACRLMDTGRHEEAMRMMHAIFDPRVGDGDLPVGAPVSARWWKVTPLMKPSSAPVIDWIAFTGASPNLVAAAAFARQVDAWRRDPFNPHLLARLRPGTYQKVTVMRYVENLIAWGDALFLRDTLESLNEATQLYVFARQILGERPEVPESTNKQAPKTYAELLAEGAFDAFGNVVLENAWPDEVPEGGAGRGAALTSSTTLTAYFCVPNNAKLMSYWDTLDDRLFKIRNGLNIDGVARTLPLFQPPIDPALLVRAAAAGIDIGTALDDLSVALPHHRFAVLHARATAIAASVRGLGQALLAAFEKGDAEELAALRQDQETAMLRVVGEVRDLQVQEAQRSLEALRSSKAAVSARKRYFDRLIEKGWIAEEEHSADLGLMATYAEAYAGYLRLLQSAMGTTPDGYGGAPAVAVVKTGGENLSRVPAGVAASFEIGAAGARGASAYLGTVSGYKRRAQEWKHQSAQAGLELAQLDKQIAGAEIRLQIARRERENHGLQVRHAEQVAEFLTGKFTNEALYRWMSSELAGIYFQQYQLALATAKKAQACYNHELGRSDTHIQSVHWDGQRRGLLAGERLTADLERMEMAYLDHDRRELELVKHVSLARLDALALVRLREDGECYFEIPEALFDLDCPGHVNRRLVGVALTATCVAGPYGQVNLRLTLQGSKVRRKASDPLAPEVGVAAAIVTSTATEDSGVFGNNDGRYAPFERRGAVSSWHLAFCNQAYKQLDWNILSDVTLHLRYTARDGGDIWRAARIEALPDELEALAGGFLDLGYTPTSGRFAVALSAKRDAPDVWAQAQEDAASGLTLPLADWLPYFAVGRVGGVAKVHILLAGVVGATAADVSASTSSEAGLVFNTWPSTGSSLLHAATDSAWAVTSGWPDALTVNNLLDGATAINLADADDLLVVLELTVT